jgi:uncharacterized protein (DUF1778 family)
MLKTAKAIPAKALPKRRQSEPLLLRLEPEHLRLISEAAEYLGLPRASWMRSTLLQAARAVLSARGGQG